MHKILDNPSVSFLNLKSTYLVPLKNVAIGLNAEATVRKDDVIYIHSAYSPDTDYCCADIYCRLEKKVLPIVIKANSRFRYAYKNEVRKCL